MTDSHLYEWVPGKRVNLIEEMISGSWASIYRPMGVTSARRYDSKLSASTGGSTRRKEHGNASTGTIARKRT